MAVRKYAEQALGALDDSGVLDQARDAAGDAVSESFAIDPDDFLSARERSESVGTRLAHKVVSLSDAGETLNRSFAERSDSGEFTNVVAPVVIPERRTFMTLLPAGLLILLGLFGAGFTQFVSETVGIGDGTSTFFGPHYWVLVVAVAVFSWWRRSIVEVPEGCAALISKFGKLEEVAAPGRTLLLNPWKQVSYIVNVTREYPYNAPIREAPTHSGVQASVDLFLQFRIEEPADFIFTLGAVQGFADKLGNAISETTRSLIYSQRAEDIYDLVGESTQGMLDTLNQQFLPAVRFTNANITHAEPSSQDYRMDLAAPEMVRVAKEAYTYEYELGLRKQQTEGELDKELATLRESLSAIRADIATYQAQMDTALERETNRAEAMAKQRLVEAESTAEANAALLEAQALDIRAVASAGAPEILEHRFEQELLDRLEAVSGSLPQVVRLPADGGAEIDFLAIARGLVGSGSGSLFSADDLAVIRERQGDIQRRIDGRRTEIDEVLAAQEQAEHDVAQPPTPGEMPGADEVEALRRSVTDDSVQQRVEALSEGVSPSERPARDDAAQPDADVGDDAARGAPGQLSDPVVGLSDPPAVEQDAASEGPSSDQAGDR